MRPEIVLERETLFFASSCGLQIIDGLSIDREIAHRGAIFGRHVSDGCAIRDRQGRGSFAVKLDKLANNFLRPEQLCDVQDQIGSRDAFAQLSTHVHAHDFRCQKVDRLAEHTGFRFDSAHAPANHAETVDHGRMRIGPNESVREEEL